MRNRIRSLFAWPTFADEETQRTAFVLRAILLVGLAAAPTGGALGLLSSPGRVYATPILAVTGAGTAAVLAALFLLYQGLVRQTVLVVLTIIWLLGLVLSFASGGLFSPGVFYFFTAILFAGVMLGPRAATVVAIGSVVVVSVLLWLEIQDVFFPNILYTSPLAVGLTHLLNLAWVTSAVLMYTRRITAALADVRRSNRELQAIRNTLEERVAQRTADLTDANEQLRKLTRAVEQSPSYVLINDTDGMIEYVNPAFTQVTGYTFAEVQGQNKRILKTGHASQDELPALWQVLETASVWSGELRSRKKNGELFWEYVRISPIRDDEGNITHYLKVAEDITQRKEIEQRYQDIFQNALIGIYRTTPDGRILVANPALLRMLGYDRVDELTRRNLEQSGYEPDYPRQRFKEQMDRTGQVMGWESAWRRSDGTVVYVRESAQAIRNANGDVVCYEGTVEDITERKRAEQALQRTNDRLELIHLVDQAVLAAHSPADIAMAVLNQLRHQMPCHRGGVMLLDAASQRLLPLATVIDGQATTRMTLNDGYPIALSDDLLHLAETGGRVSHDLTQDAHLWPLERALLAAGVRSYVLMPLVAQGQLIGVFVLGADTANAYTAEHVAIIAEIATPMAIAIRQANLYESLEVINAELEEAIQAKDEMIANVSHELRTPLTQIMGYGDLLADEVLGGLTDEQRRAVNIVRDRAKSLNDLVNILLTFQALSTEHLELEPVGPAVLLDMVKEGWRDEAERRNIALAVAVPRGLPTVQADLLRLRQMMDQLLDNALKFTPTGGTVRVGAAMQGDEVRLFVADTGIGIPADKLELVFDRFYQLDGSSTRRFGGMGMGLALAKQIVTLHGGRIWAESEGQGRGTTFHIALPAAGDPGAPPRSLTLHGHSIAATDATG